MKSTTVFMCKCWYQQNMPIQTEEICKQLQPMHLERCAIHDDIMLFGNSEKNTEINVKIWADVIEI